MWFWRHKQQTEKHFAKLVLECGSTNRLITHTYTHTHTHTYKHTQATVSRWLSQTHNYRRAAFAPCLCRGHVTFIVTFWHLPEPNISSHKEAVWIYVRARLFLCMCVRAVFWSRKAASIRLIIKTLRHLEASVKLNITLTRTRGYLRLRVCGDYLSVCDVCVCLRLSVATNCSGFCLN